MKSIIDSLFTAVSLYSIVPIPARWAKWDRDSMRYAICFFPVVGMVILLTALLWQHVALTAQLSAGLFAAIATLLPLLLSGGIHMDGFLDTIDAAASHAPPQRRLEIMADPHMGAFGVMGCGIYLLLTFGLWFQAYEVPRLMLLPALGHVVSRAFGGLGMVGIPCAKTSGLVYLFSGNASRKAAGVVCALLGAAAFGLMIAVDSLWGGVSAAACVLYFLWHRRFCIGGFGGVTGDLTGFLVQNIELLLLGVAVIGGIVG